MTGNEVYLVGWLVDSGKLGVFGTPVALFSSSAEFGPYAHWYNYNHIKKYFQASTAIFYPPSKGY